MKFDFSAADLNAMTIEQRTELSRGPFGDWKKTQTARYIAPFWWVEPRQSPLLITPPGVRVHNGTAFFAKIGDQLLCITAAHVYRGYLKAKQHYPDLWCRLGEGDFIFDAEANLCSLGGESGGVDKVDIATFHVSEEVLRRINKEPIVASVDAWPPPHPFTGQESTLIGYPGSSKLWTSAREISFGIYCGGPVVGSAGDRQITLPFVREQWVPTTNLGLPPEGMNLGGISGGPLLILTEQDRDWSFNIAGVISEMPSSTYFEMVTVEPVHFIGPEGSVLKEWRTPLRRYFKPEHQPRAV